MAELKDKELQEAFGNFSAIVMIELARIYDMLAVLAVALGAEENVNSLFKLHAEGKYFAPPPAIEVDND